MGIDAVSPLRREFPFASLSGRKAARRAGRLGYADRPNRPG